MLLVVRYWPLLVFVAVPALGWAAIRILMGVRRRRVVLEAFAAAYLGGLVYLVYFLPGRMGAETVGPLWAAVNLVPARTVVGIVRDHRGMVTWQLLGNVLLFVPLGWLLPALGSRFRRFTATLIAGLALSVTIELTQLALLATHTVRRSVDVDDVILNVIGTCVGYLLWRSVIARVGTGSSHSGEIEAGS